MPFVPGQDPNSQMAAADPQRAALVSALRGANAAAGPSQMPQMPSQGGIGARMGMMPGKYFGTPFGGMGGRMTPSGASPMGEPWQTATQGAPMQMGGRMAPGQAKPGMLGPTGVQPMPNGPGAMGGAMQPSPMAMAAPGQMNWGMAANAPQQGTAMAGQSNNSGMGQAMLNPMNKVQTNYQ